MEKEVTRTTIEVREPFAKVVREIAEKEHRSFKGQCEYFIEAMAKSREEEDSKTTAERGE